MKIPYHNETDKHVHIGPVTISPGQTRDVEDSHVPGYKKAESKPAETGNADPLAELLKRTVKDVTAELSGMSTADVERLGELEQLGQQRKGILSAISDLLLTRAANADMLAKVAALTDEELAAAIEAVSTDINADTDYVAALEAEAAKRNLGAAQ